MGLSSRPVSCRQGQVVATRKMVPNRMVSLLASASLRWLVRGSLGAPAVRRLGRQVVGSNCNILCRRDTRRNRYRSLPIIVWLTPEGPCDIRQQKAFDKESYFRRRLQLAFAISERLLLALTMDFQWPTKMF